MIDREGGTDSWWQQVTGEAILGPLKGRRRKGVFHNQLTFGLWRREKPQGRVLRPDERIVAMKEYVSADWEQRMARIPMVKGVDKDKRLEPRALVVGISLQIGRQPIPSLRCKNRVRSWTILAEFLS